VHITIINIIIISSRAAAAAQQAGINTTVTD